ncbi:MAG: glycosyltransferase family 2 protein [Candidatus Shapirobacteria bacterium]|jgi:glycosyltransferase involved in cell wall biosynthesis
MSRLNKKTQNISLLLLTKNESENIKINFDWLSECPTINEIIVVDDNSTDDTKKIIKSLETKTLTVKIFNRGLANNFSAQRNYGIEKSKNNWILWLDADERPDNKMISFLSSFDFSGSNYSFGRNDFFLGHQLKHGETANLSFVRLFDKKHGTFVNRVHEVWKSDLPVKHTNFHILHHPHKTFYSFISKINFYTTIRSQELFDTKVTSNIFEIIFYPLGKFIQNYILRLGLLDGTPGIIMALSMSLHSFLVRAKLWHLYQTSY